MTNYNRYKFNDVQIGDGVYFDDVYSGKYLTQSNFDEYWEVTGKEKNVVFLKLRHLGQDHYWTVMFDEIKRIEKRNI